MANQTQKYIALRCAGYNNVDLTAATKLGIKVTRVPSYAPEAVAEFAVGMIMTVVRKYHKSFLRVREGNFLLDGLMGFSLAGKNIGLIGTGKIGLITGRILAKGFCCNVLAHDPYPSPEAAEHGIKYVDTLEEMLGQALKSGHLGAVGLDVYERESEYFFADSSAKIIHDDVFARLLSFYNVFMTGHQAYLTQEAVRRIADTTIQNLKDLKATGTSPNLVTE
ncbi:hypothetical protein C0995_012396 [Termitomyces sp. Mi166|nr:hypothetical protein C0995_012396 [Termitomyces sp. Mi166\